MPTLPPLPDTSVSLREYFEARLAATQLAIDKAEAVTAVKLETANTRLSTLETRSAATTGEKSGVRDGWGWAVGAVGLGGGAVGLFTGLVGMALAIASYLRR